MTIDPVRVLTFAAGTFGMLAATFMILARRQALRPGERDPGGLPPVETLSPRGRRFRTAAVLCIRMTYAACAVGLALLLLDVFVS